MSIFSGSSVIAEYDNDAVPGSPSREYIYNTAGEVTTGLLAMVSSGATTYFHQDHLSVRLMTDANGNIVAQEGHFPFGEQWYQSGAGNQWFFTSYTRDSESGLDYAMARYYNSGTAAFSSPDPLTGKPGDPQSWNRYPYGRNDPIGITDPSGKSWWSSLLIDAGVAVAAYFAPELEGFLAGAGGAGAGAGMVSVTAWSPEFGVIAQSGAASAWGSVGVESAIMGGGIAAEAQAASSNGCPPNCGFRMQINVHAPSKGTVKCSGSARVLQGNSATIGKPGGFSGPSVGNIPITANGAAIIPSQWGPGKAFLRPYLSQISGVFPSVNYSFQGVVDVMGGAPPPGFPANSNVQTDMMQLNPGKLILELPGAPKDFGTTAVTLTAPSAVGCPAGTVQVP